MANITRRTGRNGNVSYLIRVFVDQKTDGTQTVKSMTWKPAPKMTEKQIATELNRQATLFEESIKTGLVSLTGNTRFEDYAARWMETAQLAPATRARYDDLLKRINPAIGHIRLERLQAHHLEMLYQNLRESGVKEKGRYAVAKGLDDLIKKRKLTKGKVAALAGVAASTVGAACAGNRISIEKAGQIAAALVVPMDSIFEAYNDTSGLAEKTVLHHHRLISSILGKAKKERIIPFNVAGEHATAPKPPHKEAKYLTDEQAQHIIELLLHEDDIRIKTALFVLLYSGVRRGELCGLSWHDIDVNNNIIHVERASQYQRKKGITEVPTKNPSSVRAIKLPQIVFDILAGYRVWWLEQKLKNGSNWKASEERLFIQADGKPINPDTINYWLDKFREQNQLPEFTPHTCRHTFITLQISSGVDIRTLQARTGHAQASTLLNIYSHAIKSAAEAAAEAVDDKLTPKAYKKA